MAKQHALFQVTSFVDNRNVDTFADGTLVTRNPAAASGYALAG